MSIAALTIDLEARLANFEAGMGRAERILERLADNTRSKFADIGSVFFGSLGATAFTELTGAVTNLLPELINGVARFQDMAEASNASAQGLASLRTAADVSGVSVEDLNGFMNKLTAGLSKVTDDSKGAGRAIAALGLDVAKFRTLRPDEQIQSLAGAFNGYQDSLEKSAIAQAAFGRGGAQVLRFFKELEAQGGATVRVTEAQILAADAYSDTIARSRSELRQQAELIALQSLPALTALHNIAGDLVRQLFGVGDASRELRAEDAILDWTESAALAVGTVAEALVGLGKLVRAVGASFKVVGADLSLAKKIFSDDGKGQIELVLKGTGPLADAFKERDRVVAEANARYVDLWNFNGVAVTDAIKRNFSAARLALDSDNNRELAKFKRQAEAGKVLPKLAPFALSDPKEDQAIERRQRAYESLVESIKLRNDAATIELRTGEKQTELDAFAAQVRGKLAASTSDLTETQRAAVEAALSGYLINARTLDQQREAAKLRAADSQALAAQLADRTAANRKLAEENEAIGLTARQVEELTNRRLEAAIAAQQERIETVALFDAEAASLGQMRDVLAAMREQLRLRQEAAAIKKQQQGDTGRGVREAMDEFIADIEDKAGTAKRFTGDIFRSLTDDLTASLRTGQFNIKRTVDMMIDELLRINVVKPALQWLTELGGGVVSKAIGFLLGSANGNAFMSGRVQPFARGGIFGPNGGLMTGPTLFPMAGGRVGLGGEAGTEAVLPLVRGRGGRLGVETTGGGGGSITKVDNVFNVGAGVTRPEVMALLQSYGSRLKADILQTINR